MAERTEIGARIATRRKELRLDQKAVAEMAGMAPSTFSGIENGDTREFSATWLVPMARALQVSVDWLLGVDERRPAADMIAEILPARELALLRAFRSATRIERIQMESYVAGLAARRKRRARASSSPFKNPQRAAPDRKAKQS